MPPIDTTIFFALHAKAVIAALVIRIFVLYITTHVGALQFWNETA